MPSTVYIIGAMTLIFWAGYMWGVGTSKNAARHPTEIESMPVDVLDTLYHRGYNDGYEHGHMAASYRVARYANPLGAQVKETQA